MPQSFADALSWVPKSRDLAATLARAYDYARAQAHCSVTLEHLLLALIADSDASLVLQACNVDLARLNVEASNYLVGLAGHAPPEQAGEAGADPDLVRILDYASAAARQSRRAEVNGAIVLAAVVGDGRSAAAAMLRALGLTFEEAIKALQRATGATVPEPASPAPAPASIAPSEWAAAPPAAPQPVAPADAPPPWLREGAPPHAHSEIVASHPGNVTWGPSTEELLAVARRRVAAGRPNAATPLAPYPPDGDQSEPDLRAPLEPWPELPPATLLSSPAEPCADVGTDPHPQAESWGSAEQSAGPPAAGSDLTLAAAPEARDVEALPIFPTRPEPLPPRPQPVAPMTPLGPAPHRPETEGPNMGAPPPARVAPPQPAEAPPSQPSYALWPGPVDRRQRAHDPRLDFAFDSNMAGPPYLPPDDAALSRLPAAGARKPSPSAAPHRQAGAPAAGRLVENLPRTMPAGIPKIVEARIGKASVQALAEGLQGTGTAYRHDVIITKAMSVRLRAPDGGFWIETTSPETQWIENTLGLLTDDFASWRWTVTPQRRGRARLQLIVSARTVGSDGLAAETALQDQIIEVRVQTNYGQVAARWGGWVAAAVVGGMLARFGEGVWNAGLAAFNGLSGF